jgi:hypothetical protein
MSIEHDHDDLPVNRRHALCGGGAAAFGAIITSLLSGTRPVRAEAISGTVPEVDGLRAGGDRQLPVRGRAQ